MAHSCIYCQKYIIVQPRYNEDTHWVNVLEVEHQAVIGAASDGCAFFAWCLLTRSHLGGLLLDTRSEETVLRGYVSSRDRSDGSDGLDGSDRRPALSLRWEGLVPDEEPIQNDLGLLHIMAEPGTCNINSSLLR